MEAQRRRHREPGMMKNVDYCRGLVRAWRGWRERRRSLRILDAMGRHELKDLGLTPSDIPAIRAGLLVVDPTRRQR